MSDNTAPRAEDRVNTYAIVVVGLVGALLTYVSIVALQAYYASSIGQELAVKDVAGLGTDYNSLKAEQISVLSEYGRSGDKLRLPIERAKELVLEDARNRASSLVPAVGEHDTPTVDPATGKAIGAPAAPAPGGDGATPAAPADGSGAAGGTYPAGTPGGGPMDTEGTPPPTAPADDDSPQVGDADEYPGGEKAQPSPRTRESDRGAPDNKPPAVPAPATPEPGGDAPTP